jgi:hypothetical protein
VLLFTSLFVKTRRLIVIFNMKLLATARNVRDSQVSGSPSLKEACALASLLVAVHGTVCRCSWC